LNSHQVDYLLVGDYAVSIHGYPRYTGDIDFWVDISEENAQKLVNVLKEFGFDLPNLSTEIFLDKSRMTRLGREPVKIEILNSVSGLDFKPAQLRAITVDIDGITIPVISLSDLRQNKLASGRAKDLADLENLPLAENET
jgi:predicted nucleotidyltransferase